MAERLVLTVGGSRVLLTEHAIERYQARVRPGLGFGDVVGELRRVAEHARVTTEPGWVNEPSTGRSEPVDAYLVIGDSVAFPLFGGRAVTCLTRGEPSHRVLQKRAEHRARRAAVRKVRRQNQREKPGDKGPLRRPLREMGG